MQFAVRGNVTMACRKIDNGRGQKIQIEINTHTTYLLCPRPFFSPRIIYYLFIYLFCRLWYTVRTLYAYAGRIISTIPANVRGPVRFRTLCKYAPYETVWFAGTLPGDNTLRPVPVLNDAIRLYFGLMIENSIQYIIVSSADISESALGL